MKVCWTDVSFEGRGETAARWRGRYCDSEVDLTYELFAWYEPLLMIDLMMIMKLELCVELLWMSLSMMFDDGVGWMGKGERWKKVGISSLSKKVMIRQARADYALVGNHLFDVLELSIPFCDFVGLTFW